VRLVSNRAPSPAFALESASIRASASGNPAPNSAPTKSACGRCAYAIGLPASFAVSAASYAMVSPSSPASS
jgi:hypothetical protein